MKIQLCLVVLLLGVSLNSSDATITARVCEHRGLYLRCPYGRQIHIEYALYGRTEHGICGGPVRTIDCRSGSSLYRVRSYCQGRQSCSVRASNGVFGDPCSGTFKYLEVKYSCVTPQTNPRNVLACEHQAVQLECPSGRQIDIEYALYGRTQHGICGGPVRTIDCRSGSSLYRVRSYCQGRHSCSVRASNGVFGDPCYGTFKYLEVKYSCVSHYTNPRNVLACEHQTAQLQCPWGRKIFVAATTYGRSQARHVCGGPVKTTRCRSSSSWTQVSARCHGRRTCSVRASNSVFGDPCYGTFKYLDVQYFCLP